jgi:hypothetical protein
MLGLDLVPVLHHRFAHDCAQISDLCLWFGADTIWPFDGTQATQLIAQLSFDATHLHPFPLDARIMILQGITTTSKLVWQQQIWFLNCRSSFYLNHFPPPLNLFDTRQHRKRCFVFLQETQARFVLV